MNSSFRWICSINIIAAGATATAATTTEKLSLNIRRSVAATAEALKPQRTSLCSILWSILHLWFVHPCLEALAVDDGGARLVVLGLGDPHLLEGGEGGEDGAANPDGVLALRGSDHLDIHGGGSKGGELLGHALANALEHGGAAREDDVGVEVLTDVDVALHDGLEGAVVDARGLLADEGRLEEDLGSAEALVTNGDDVAVGQLVGLVDGGRLGGSLHLLVEVEGDVGELLLDVTDNLTLSGGGEGVATLGEDLHHVVGEVAAGEVEAHDGVGKGVTLVDRDGVGDTIARVEHAASGTARGVEGEHSLDVDVHRGAVEGLEHDL